MCDDENNRVCLLLGLGRSTDRRFASWRGAPLGGVVCVDYCANLDWCFGLVLRLVFADTARMIEPPSGGRKGGRELMSFF